MNRHPERVSTPVVEDFPKVSLDYLRVIAGGSARLRRCESLDVPLPDGRTVAVQLSRVEDGSGGQIRMLCPGGCSRTCRKLYLVPIDPPLLCIDCLRRTYKIRYRSQLEWNRRRVRKRRSA